jgi:transcriptional/translational regulatory protein YebC/TACO1
MAGHSKWKQIKHKKAAADSRRSGVFARAARAITAAVRAADGERGAPQVLALIERAKQIDMPKENIERAIARGAGLGSGALIQLTFESFGPGGVALIFTAMTDSRNRTVQEIKHILNEHDVLLGTEGSALWAFTKVDGKYLPHQTVKLPTEAAEQLEALIEALEEHDDIDTIFTNQHL